MGSPRPVPPARAAVRTDTVFVGRRAEFAALEEIWAAVEDSRRQVVLVGGEPGVGKSRLVTEAAQALSGHGAAILWGGCYADFEVPYGPFVTVLEQLLDDWPTEGPAGAELPAEVAAPLLRLTSKVRAVSPDVDEVGAGARDSRPALFDAVVHLLRTSAARTPTVLVLEDLQWASEPTRSLLSHVVRSSAGERLLLLVTRRTTAPDRSDELTYVLADLHRLDGVTRMDLAGLTTEDVAEYLVRGVGAGPGAARVAAPVLRDHTGGNPFFLLEYWHDLESRGGLEAVRSPTLRAPASVQDALERRLSTLPADQARVIELAAVAGDDVEPAVLVAASDGAADAVLEGLDVALRAGLLVDDPPGRQRFAHALARQAVLDRMSGSRRAALHARIASVLEARGEVDAKLAARLAHHYGQAHALGHAAEAVRYLVLTARQAERSIAYGEAAMLYARAARLRAGDTGTAGPNRSELLFSAARCHLHAGEFPAARQLYAGLARSEDVRIRLRAAIGHEDASSRPGVDGGPSLALLEEAMRAAPSDSFDALHIQALASRGRASGFVGDAAAARVLGDRALALARDAGSDELVAHALATSLWQGITPQLAPELLARAIELHQLGTRLDNADHLGPAAFYRAVFAYALGDAGEWTRARRDLAATARAGGQPFFRYVAGCARYAHRFAVGDFAGAGQTVEWLEEFDDEFEGATEGSSGVQQFMLRRATDRLEAVRGMVTGTESEQENWAPGLLALYTGLGVREPAARVLTHLSQRIGEYRRITAQWAGVLAFLTDAVVLLEDERTAARLRPLVAEYRGMNLVAGQFVAVFGSADRYLAMLDSLLDAPNADEHFERALEMDRRMGAVAHQAETLWAWSRHAARTRGAPGAVRAGRLAEEAGALAQTIGHRRVLRELGDPPTAVELRSRPNGLTDREVDVLRLVADGLSNREIGEQLFISQNTAANHVRSILLKTGAPNRTKAAIFAAEHNLLPTAGR